MAHYRFVRNRHFIRSIPGVGRGIYHEFTEKQRGELPYLSRADELAERKAMNKFRREQVNVMNASALDRIKEIVTLGQTRLALKAAERAPQTHGSKLAVRTRKG